jgi:PAS domain S-box-containing protein
MDYQNTTKEELLKDLHDLQQKYDAISLLYETEKSTLAALVENNSDVMLVKDCNRRIIAGNSAFLDAAGFNSLTELIGKTDADILNIPENSEPVFSYKQEDLKALQLPAGEIIQREENIPFPNGELKTFLTKKFPIFINKKLIGIGVITSDITKRKQAEQNLLELNHQYLSQSERLKILNRHYQLVNDYSSDVTAMYDDAGKPVYISPSVKSYVGYEASEFTKVSVFDIVHPDDKQQLFTEIEGYKAKGIKDYTTTYRIKHKNGHYFWNESVCHVIEESGETYTIVNSRNIDERKKAELAIRESEKKYRLLIDNISDLVCEIDEDGIYTFVSSHYKELLGYEPEELIGQYVIDLIHPDDLIVSQKKYEQIKNTFEKSIDTWRFKHKNGEYRIIESKGTVYTNSKNEKRTVVISRDITERKVLEDELKEKTSFLSTIMETSPVGIVTVDKTGTITYANNRAEQILGLVKEEITSRTYDAPLWEHTNIDGSPFPDEKQPFNIVKKSLKTVFDIQHGITWPDGRVVLLSINATPIKDNKGEFDGMIASIEDITEHKKAEKQIKDSERNLIIKNEEYESINEELKQTNEELIIAKEKAEEANRLKTKFLNNMSHEVRTPMNGIIGFSELLNSNDISEEERKYYSQIVQHSSNQLLSIIDAILEISTLETEQEKLNETEFSLNDLLTKLFSIFNLKSKEKNIPLFLKTQLQDDQSHIISDKTKLSKILSNLIENALKFTNKGFVEFGYLPSKTNLILYVKDTGIGISPENHQIIFERFAQEDKGMAPKYGGLGLGLSICKENAKLLGGDITVESEKSKGSTFFVTIPYKPTQIEDDNIKKSSKEIKNSNKQYSILVVEDEEVNYLYIKALFKNKTDGNYKLIHAKNGKEAVEICMANNNIDLVLMDIKMPIMNGHEATEKIKEKFPNLPVIAQTAYSTESDKHLALKHRCDDFVTKPIDKEKLFRLMDKHLTGK